ncbi:MAG: thermonuclease family protein [Gammaproteobacteria bacterium]
MTRPLFRLLTLLGLALSIGSAWAEQLVGKVIGVTDGDTLRVLTAQRQQHRVRLSGIDAPEKRQAFGQVSKQHLSDLVYGKIVSVVFHKRDRYQRILGKVLVNGADAGLNQIQSGMAWHYKRYEREQFAEDRVPTRAPRTRPGQSGAGSGAILPGGAMELP